MTLRIARIGGPIALLILAYTSPALACDVITLGPPRTAADYVRDANAIVRVTAPHVYLSQPPNVPYSIPESFGRIAFSVVEVLKGDVVAPEIVLPGFLMDRDDFNEGPVPYTLARPSSQGPCFADVYKRGADFLLLLRRQGDGSYTARLVSPGTA
jgi:hypothetical protein